MLATSSRRSPTYASTPNQHALAVVLTDMGTCRFQSVDGINFANAHQHLQSTCARNSRFPPLPNAQCCPKPQPPCQWNKYCQRNIENRGEGLPVQWNFKPTVKQKVASNWQYLFHAP